MTKKKDKERQELEEKFMKMPQLEKMDTSNSTGHSRYYYDFDRNKGEYIGFDEKLDLEVQKIVELLKSKNKAYGNSALNPAGIFSKLNATESLCARIDDKIMRIKNKGINDETEDTVDDLIGYLLLLKMSM